MLYVIANTSTKDQRLYAVDGTTCDKGLPWELVKVESTQHNIDGSIALTAETLAEIESKKVAVFESKKQARAAYKSLGIKSGRYVSLALAQQTPGSSSSTLTDLNSKLDTKKGK